MGAAMTKTFYRQKHERQGALRRHMKAAAATAVAACVAAGIGMPVAHAEPDPSEYFKQLAQNGFLVNSTTKPYLLQLANMACDMDNAGWDLGEIGKYFQNRENLSHMQGFTLAMDAVMYYCTKLHPQLVPYTPSPQSR